MPVATARDADTVDDLIASRKARPGKRTRYDEPSARSQARRLPGDTDPEDIDDPAVRSAFIDRMHDEFSKAEDAGELGDEEDPHAPKPSPRPRATGASGAPTVQRVSSQLEVGDSIGSAVLGVLAYALLLNYIRGGWSQVRRWIAAKATNGGGSLP